LYPAFQKVTQKNPKRT